MNPRNPRDGTQNSIAHRLPTHCGIVMRLEHQAITDNIGSKIAANTGIKGMCSTVGVPITAQNCRWLRCSCEPSRPSRPCARVRLQRWSGLATPSCWPVSSDIAPGRKEVHTSGAGQDVSDLTPLRPVGSPLTPV